MQTPEAWKILTDRLEGEGSLFFRLPCPQRPEHRQQESYGILLPGLDSSVMQSSPLWGSVVGPLIWDQARLEYDPGTGELSFRWIYWSMIQTLLHVSITLVFLLGAVPSVGTALLAVLANLIPAGLSIMSCQRTVSRVRAAGFRPGSPGHGV